MPVSSLRVSFVPLSLALIAGSSIAADRASVNAVGGVSLPSGMGERALTGAERGATHSVARRWNDAMLAAIRRDTPRPPVHSRNLFHVSAAMYDAWAAYDPSARPIFRNENASSLAIESARDEAISFAAYRVLAHRFANSPGAAISLAAFDALMSDLGYDPMNTTTVGDSPAAVGNRIGASIIAQGMGDHSNEANNFADTSGYAPVNGPLVVENAGTGGIADINRWQPLIVPGAANPQGFLTPHWGSVTPYAMERPAPGAMYLDPGAPPMLGGAGDATVRANVIQLVEWSGFLDPSDGAVVNISPALNGNNPLGTQDGEGHAMNPSTGMPYPDVFVPRGDYGRVLAEFWADGPLSSTPPGHWNEIANAVSDYPGFEKRIGGSGPVVSDLEWDVKVYLALNGAVHDAAIATWEVKAAYDYVRPISLIREMATLGQSSDSNLPSYDPNGLPLVPGLIELITVESSAPGERHEDFAAFVGEIAIFAWRGHPADPLTEYGGCGWILGDEWLPYQQFNFVTPPFAGYTSGHSGFSRASAEVLTLITGSEFFPGGYGEFVSSNAKGGFGLGFEDGPSMDVPLTWATYYDAADEAGLSRIYGGIHPAIDDFPGRILGSQAGIGAWAHSMDAFAGLIPFPCDGDTNGDNLVNLTDLDAVLSGYGASGAGMAGDVNGDGVVNFADLNETLSAFGTECE